MVSAFAWSQPAGLTETWDRRTSSPAYAVAGRPAPLPGTGVKPLWRPRPASAAGTGVESRRDAASHACKEHASGGLPRPSVAFLSSTCRQPEPASARDESSFNSGPESPRSRVSGT